MASNKRGGLSKREYAAAKSGGTLNYKTGKVTTPKKSSGKSASTANPYQGIIDSVYRGDLTREEADQQIVARGGKPGEIYGHVQDFYETSNKMPSARPGMGDNPNYSATKRAEDYNNSKSSDPYKQAGQKVADSKFTLGDTTPASNSGLNIRGTGTNVDTYGSTVGASSLGQQQNWNNLPQQKKFRLDGQPDWLLPQDQSLDPGLSNSGVNPLFQELMLGAPKDMLAGMDINDSAAKIMPRESQIGTANDPINQQNVPSVSQADKAVPSTGGGTGVGIGAGAAGDLGMSVGSSKGTTKKNKGDDAPDSDKFLKEIQQQYEAAFEEMLNSLDPQYKGYQDEYEQELQKQMMNEKNALLARQMAYGTADSEQREQAEARMAGEFADKRSTFMRRLAEQEAAQRGELGMQRMGTMADLGMKRYQAAMDAWKYQQAQAQQEFENQLAMLRYRQGNSDTSQNNLMKLLTQASNMTSGGDLWATNNAPLFGLTADQVRPYVSKENWGDGFRDAYTGAVSTKVWETDALGNPVSYIDEKTGNIIPVR